MRAARSDTRHAPRSLCGYFFCGSSARSFLKRLKKTVQISAGRGVQADPWNSDRRAFDTFAAVLARVTYYSGRAACKPNPNTARARRGGLQTEGAGAISGWISGRLLEVPRVAVDVTFEAVPVTNVVTAFAISLSPSPLLSSQTHCIALSHPLTLAAVAQAPSSIRRPYLLCRHNLHSACRNTPLIG